MYKIVVFSPADHAEKIKDAMFEAGGGKLGNYDKCAFVTEGIGQYRPLVGSDPHLGEEGRVEKVRELRIEMIALDDCIKKVVDAMKGAHPYEEIAYDVIKLCNSEILGE